MKSTFSLIFYSKEHNFTLSKIIREETTKQGGLALNIDDIFGVITNKYSYIEYLVLDFTQSILDEKSISFLSRLHEDGQIGKIVAILNKDAIFDYKILKIIFDENFSQNFRNFMEDLVEERRATINPSLGSWRRIIGTRLCNWGFSPKHNGLGMLIDIVIYYTSKNCVIRNLSKEAYVFLGQKYRISISCVELNLRKAIKYAYIRGKIPFFDTCPTNKEFINYIMSQFYDDLVNVVA